MSCCPLYSLKEKANYCLQTLIVAWDMNNFDYMINLYLTRNYSDHLKQKNCMFDWLILMIHSKLANRRPLKLSYLTSCNLDWWYYLNRQKNSKHLNMKPMNYYPSNHRMLTMMKYFKNYFLKYFNCYHLKSILIKLYLNLKSFPNFGLMFNLEIRNFSTINLNLKVMN